MGPLDLMQSSYSVHHLVGGRFEEKLAKQDIGCASVHGACSLACSLAVLRPIGPRSIVAAPQDLTVGKGRTPIWDSAELEEVSADLAQTRR